MFKPQTHVIVAERGHPATARLVRDKAPWKAVLGTRIIIARSLCTYECQRLTGTLKGEKLRQSLVLRAKANSPYRNAQVRLHLGPTHATIWSWDGDLVESRLGLSNRQIVPESVFHKPEDGYRITESIDGFEGALWVGGELMESRWWAEVPEAEAWRQFVLATEHLSGGTRDRPRTELFDGRFETALADHTPPAEVASRLRWKELALVGVLILALPILLFGARGIYLSYLERDLETRFETERLAKSQLRRDASDAVAQRREARQIAAVLGQPHPLPAIADAIGEITRLGGTVQRVHFDSNGVEIGFSVAGPFSQPEFVRSLEEKPAVRGASIRAEPAAGQWAISFGLNFEPSTGG